MVVATIKYVHLLNDKDYNEATVAKANHSG